MVEPSPSRRSLLTGLVKSPGPESDSRPARPAPGGSSTVRLTARCMACDFSVIMNPGSSDRVAPAGETLELISSIEGWMSLYRSDSELSLINQNAGIASVRIRPELSRLIRLGLELSNRTDGGFDIAMGALTLLWRRCRREERLPVESEIQEALKLCGSANIRLEEAAETVELKHHGVTLDPGAIGKGFALDEAADFLRRQTDAPAEFLLHGGHSSVLAVGGHNGHDGWPIGLGNPLFTEKRLATVLLRNQAMGTSGSNIQFFRYQGKRYGHILDPKTGWPADGMLSVTVIAHSAAVADALSTAFFAMGVDRSLACLDSMPDIGAILVPFPESGRKVRPVVAGIPSDQIFWDEDQAEVR
ncbi:MAG: FAD:protein FMN transferase [Planctomycetaceae bacterium]